MKNNYQSKSDTNSNAISPNGEAQTITSGSGTINPPMSYGWVCPKCGRVNAPWKDHCDCDGVTRDNPIIFDTDYPFYQGQQLRPPYEFGDTPPYWIIGPTCVCHCDNKERTVNGK